MMYWVGVLATPAAIALFVSARLHRARVLAARADAIRHGYPAERPANPDSIAALGELVTPIVLCALAYLALKTRLAYYMLNNGALSIFDLTGTLLLLGAYGTWLKIKTGYRMPRSSIATLDADAATTSYLAGIEIQMSGATTSGATQSGPTRPPVRQRVGARVQMPPARPNATAAAHRDAQPTFAPE